MRILIVSMNVGRTAPGIVFERLIKGLSEYHELDVLTADYDPSSNLDKVNRIIKYEYTQLNQHISEFFISIFGANPVDIYFAYKSLSLCDDKYDLVISFISSGHYVPVIIGNMLAKKRKLKHLTHTVDAIPAPGGWIKNRLFLKGLHRFVFKNFSKVDGLFAANRNMLDYQMTTFRPKKNLITEVLHNPTSRERENYKYNNGNINTFLYTGGIYGPRKPDYILAAFKKILEQFPDSTLEFVGSKLSDESISIFDLVDRKKVITHPFARDLTSYYERAIALIDIDGDVPNDVFLSGKISNYIMINRIIITETGDNTPSRNLFRGIPSILQCGHDKDELAAAMKYAILHYKKMDFTDRTKVISLFDLDFVIQKLNNKLDLEG